MASTSAAHRFFPAIVLFIIFFNYAVGFPTPPYFSGDAEQYWQLGASFFSGGSLSLLGGEQTFRGYLLPLIFGLCQRLGAALAVDPFFIYYVVNCAFTALALAMIVPLLIEYLFGIRVSNLRILIFSGLFFVFWRGYLLEPLSDTWSLFLVIGAILAAVRAAERNRLAAVALALLGGLLMGAAVNIRPIYLICLPLYFIGMAALMWSRPKRMMVLACVGILGAAFPLFPQSLINHHYLGSWNPFIQSGSLYVLQLFFGLSVQRNECAYFVDPSGIAMLKASGVNTLVRQANGSYLYNFDVARYSIMDYIRIVFNRPIDAAAIYMRHVINGLTLLSSNIYACRPGQPRSLLNLASLGIVISAGAAAILVPVPLRNTRLRLLVWIPLVPVAFVIPAAMEGRFFFPLHLWAYAVICFLVPLRRLSAALAAHGRIAVPAVLAIFLLAVTQVSDTFGNTYIWRGASDVGVRLTPLTVLIEQ